VRKILLTGKNGQVGWELQRTLASLGDVVAVGHREMDLADPDSIRKFVREVRPGLIVNAAAYTAVDKAESEPDLAMAVNGVAPGIMAEEAKRLKAAIIHYSTDYVFDGTKERPYVEDDAPNPLNVYGRTKLAGEQAIQAVGAPHLILRTSWVYGCARQQFFVDHSQAGTGEE
jgi:dTDP-4-dehydrorhamnose reductase